MGMANYVILLISKTKYCNNKTDLRSTWQIKDEVLG